MRHVLYYHRNMQRQDKGVNLYKETSVTHIHVENNLLTFDHTVYLLKYMFVINYISFQVQMIKYFLKKNKRHGSNSFPQQNFNKLHQSHSNTR